MNNTLRKALLFGIGVFHISREKVETFVQDLQKDGNLTPEEGKKVVDEVMKKAEAEGKKLTNEIDRVVREVLEENDVQVTETKTSSTKKGKRSSTKKSAKKSSGKVDTGKSKSKKSAKK